MKKPRKEFLSTRACRLLEKQDLTCQEMVPLLPGETLKRVRQCMLILHKKQNVTAEKIRHGEIKYHLVRMPANRDIVMPGWSPKEKREHKQKTHAGSGVIAPPRCPRDLTGQLHRDPFAAWRMCQRDPLAGTQSAVFSFKR